MLAKLFLLKLMPSMSHILEIITICYIIPCTKGFDCVDHNKLWKILKEIGIQDHLTYLLGNLYASQEATVRTVHEGSLFMFSNMSSPRHVHSWTWNNRLVPNWERRTSRLYIVTLLI